LVCVAKTHVLGYDIKLLSLFLGPKKKNVSMEVCMDKLEAVELLRSHGITSDIAVTSVLLAAATIVADDSMICPVSGEIKLFKSQKRLFGLTPRVRGRKRSSK
jgi:hypothetical protein